jgi:hypothetical protein
VADELIEYAVATLKSEIERMRAQLARLEGVMTLGDKVDNQGWRDVTKQKDRLRVAIAGLEALVVTHGR